MRSFFGLEDAAEIAEARPPQDEQLAARGELHVKDRLAGLQGLDNASRRDVDDLYRVVARVREVDPDLASVGARHGEHGLSVDRNPRHLAPGAARYHEHLVAADGGQEDHVTRARPAFEVRHFVDG